MTMTAGLRVPSRSMTGGLRLWNGSGLDLCLVVRSHMVKAMVMDT